MRSSAVQVGDVLIVDSDTHTVEEISLSTTVMRRWARMPCQSPTMTTRRLRHCSPSVDAAPQE